MNPSGPRHLESVPPTPIDSISELIGVAVHVSRATTKAGKEYFHGWVEWGSTAILVSAFDLDEAIEKCFGAAEQLTDLKCPTLDITIDLS